MAAVAKQPGKHVIFLGAGASLSSGYPHARKLRLLMTSPGELFSWMQQHLGGLTEFDFPTMAHVRAVLQPFQKTLQLFQDGGYASVDEFGMLARGKMQKEVQELKMLMTFVLALVNPRFAHDSAYFPFVNALFKPDSTELRDDIAILTFNYDPHLEFMIARARKVRVEATGAEMAGQVSNSTLLSGFFNDQRRWHEETGFFVGKLHGTIAVEPGKGASTDRLLTFNDVFGIQHPAQRFDVLKKVLTNGCTPVAFPWELLDENGFIKPESECPWNCDVPGVGPLRGIMESIWARAVNEIEQASTISFVGLSMHHYLVPGVRRLFQRKRGKVKVVVANPDIRDMSRKLYETGEFHPRCSLRKIRACLQEVAPEMEITSAPHYLGFESFISGEVVQ